MNNTSDVWLNIEEVCSLTNSKKETIRRKCKSGEYKCRFELAGRNKNYQILLSSMPLKYIEKYKSFPSVSDILGQISCFVFSIFSCKSNFNNSEFALFVIVFTIYSKSTVSSILTNIYKSSTYLINSKLLIPSSSDT